MILFAFYSLYTRFARRHLRHALKEISPKVYPIEIDS